jgi:glucose dehydrogenase
MIPVLFEGLVGGKTRPLVAIGDKAGNFVLLDRNTGEAVHRLVVSRQVGLNTAPTPDGTEACPNHGGGIDIFKQERDNDWKKCADNRLDH